MSNPKFNNVLIIGVGLIGSSLARSIKKNNIAKKIFGLDPSKDVLKKCEDLNILFDSKTELKDFSIQFDLIIICSPLSTYKNIFLSLND